MPSQCNCWKLLEPCELETQQLYTLDVGRLFADWSDSEVRPGGIASLGQVESNVRWRYCEQPLDVFLKCAFEERVQKIIIRFRRGFPYNCYC